MYLLGYSKVKSKTNYMAKKFSFRSGLIAVAMLFAVFGGLYFIIQADYMSAAWSTAYYWIGGILLGGFALTMIIWFASSGKRG